MARGEWLPNLIFKRQVGELDRFKLYDVAKGSTELVQRMEILRTLPVHKGCVNSICWSACGQYILSGSDDKHLCITDASTGNVKLKYLTTHSTNIYCAKYLPLSSDKKLISSEGNGTILYTDLERTDDTLRNTFCCHLGTAYELVTVATEPYTFLSCGEDGTVRWYDLRVKEKCLKRPCKSNILVGMTKSVNTIAINPMIPYQLAVGSSESLVNVYDRRMLPRHHTMRGDGAEICRFTVPEIESKALRTTSLCYSPDGDQLLASYSSDFIYLFNLNDKPENTAVRMEPPAEAVKKAKSNCPLMKRLRLRGDWSDTGPNARPETEDRARATVSQERPTIHNDILHQVTQLLSHLLNHPMARYMAESQGEPSSPESDGASRPTEDLPRLSMAYAVAGEGQETRNEGETEEDCGTTDEDELLSDSPSSSKCSNKKKYVKRIAYSKKYTGHRNARTMIKESTFWGRNHIVSGSDCGHVFFWDRNTAELLMVFPADKHVVNCVQPHPLDTVLATSGIDYDVKLWAPTKCDNGFDDDYAQELIKRNAVMLEETHDTITVPPTFLVRMLCTLNQLRRDRERRQERTEGGAAQEGSHGEE